MNVIKNIIDEKVYGVVRVAEGDKVVEISEALIKGGLKTIEIVISNSSVIDAVKYLTSKYDISIGASGIITQRQANQAISAGSKFIVSPIFQMNLVKFCQNNQMPLLNTATTPNEAYEAWKARIPLIKIYPAKPMGGAEYIEDLLRPMPFLHVIATGSIQLDGFTDYFDAGASAVGIGRAFYKDASPSEIVERVQTTIATLNSYIQKQ